jgi:hypothetical protein
MTDDDRPHLHPVDAAMLAGILRACSTFARRLERDGLLLERLYHGEAFRFPAVSARSGDSGMWLELRRVEEASVVKDALEQWAR